MKLLLSLFIIALASAHSHYEFIDADFMDELSNHHDHHQPTHHHSGKGLKELIELFDYYFEGFGIKETIARDCYDEDMARAQFKMWKVSDRMLRAFERGDPMWVNRYMRQINEIYKVLAPAMDCYVDHPNFYQLLKKVQFDYKDLEDLERLMIVYDQAHLNDIAILFHPIEKLIHKRKFEEAAKKLVPLDVQAFKNASRHNFHYEELKAFQNGVFFWLKLESPFGLDHCYNDGNGRIGYEFFTGWACAIANANVHTVYEETEKYFDGIGGELLRKYRSTLNCFDKTDDQHRLNDAIGIDINDDSFEDAVFDFIQNNPGETLSIFQLMHKMILKDCPLCAGMCMAEFYTYVAESMEN